MYEQTGQPDSVIQLARVLRDYGDKSSSSRRAKDDTATAAARDALGGLSRFCEPTQTRLRSPGEAILARRLARSTCKRAASAEGYVGSQCRPAARGQSSILSNCKDAWRQGSFRHHRLRVVRACRCKTVMTGIVPTRRPASVIRMTSNLGIAVDAKGRHSHPRRCLGRSRHARLPDLSTRRRAHPQRSFKQLSPTLGTTVSWTNPGTGH